MSNVLPSSSAAATSSDWSEARALLCPPCGIRIKKDYPGDAAAKTALAQWMGYRAAKAGLPAELPVMAALVESNLTNVAVGDGDAAGFFEMRVSVWNTGRYFGFPTNPQLRLQWFLDQALLVRDQRLASGLPITEEHWGEWIVDVERPAEQFRGRYQLRLGEAHCSAYSPVRPPSVRLRSPRPTPRGRRRISATWWRGARQSDGHDLDRRTGRQGVHRR